MKPGVPGANLNTLTNELWQLLTGIFINSLIEHNLLTDTGHPNRHLQEHYYYYHHFRFCDFC